MIPSLEECEDPAPLCDPIDLTDRAVARLACPRMLPLL
jgi:hypothetical protein